MAHHTRYIVLHSDGNSQSFVGNPQPSRFKAELEALRLVNEEGFAKSELAIVEVPN